MAQLDLSNAEFELILDNYAVDETRVNYFRFCDDLEAVFTAKNLEKTNTEVILPSTDPRYGVTGLDRSGNYVANNVINRFRDFMVNKVLDVKSHF
mmetsp:Transcript_1268/g.133  ORF Transcript_1268/g.133 Transcript_1268/m.133 type:complete len:95 (-) Transcript_1268:904-1188(-)